MRCPKSDSLTAEVPRSRNSAVLLCNQQQCGTLDYLSQIDQLDTRGPLFNGDKVNLNSDIGGMELYAENVIGTDPYDVIKALKPYFSK